MIIRVGVLIAICFFVATTVSAQIPEKSPRKTVEVGVVIDGPAERLKGALELIRSEIMTLTQTEFDVRFSPDKTIVADWKPDGIRQAVDRLLADPQVDIVVGVGPIASNDLVIRETLPKPVLAPFVINKGVQVLAGPDGKFKRRNLSYIVWSLYLERDLKAFVELGDFRRIAFIGAGYIGRAIPKLLEELVRQSKQLGVTIVPIYGEDSAQKTLQQLPPEIDAVYLGPNPQLSLSDVAELATGFIERKLPSFSWFGRSEVEKGILAGLGGPEDFVRLARRVALNMQRIMQGEPPENLVTAFKLTEQLVINMNTARALNVWPDFAVLSDAILLNTERERVKRKLTIHSAIKEAIRVNLELKAADKMVLAGEESVREAQSQLLPHLGVSASGSMIDEDRAGLGQSERTVDWSASLYQSIFDQGAWANLEIQDQLQEARKHNRQRTELDVVITVALAYLYVLKAKTYERIKKENLRLTRSHLALARLRQQIGISGPSEVYRWEAQVASSRRNLIATVSQRNQAEIALNVALNRPAEEPFLTEETSLDDPGLLSSEKAFLDYFANPFRFKILREFMVQEGLKRAPELHEINAALSAKQEQVDANWRKLFVPSFGLQAKTTHRIHESGAGSDGFELPPQFRTLVPLPDDFDWYVGVTASLPLYEGGARYASIRRSEHQLSELKFKKEAALDRIERRIRAALHQAGASFPAIKLSRDEAQAAKDNLELVTDAYNRGAASIVTLLDAQNQSLISDLAAANAIYTFLSDLMSVERAVGRFDFFESKDQRDKLISRLNRYRSSRKAKQ